MDKIEDMGDVSEKFTRYKFMENYPEVIDKGKDEKFKAYIWKELDGGTILVEFEKHIEVYIFDNGPYMYQGSVGSFKEAAKMISTFT